MSVHPERSNGISESKSVVGSPSINNSRKVKDITMAITTTVKTSTIELRHHRL